MISLDHRHLTRFRRKTFGRSGDGHPLLAFTLSGVDRPTLMIAGCHGDEPKGVALALRLVEWIEALPGLVKSPTGIVVVPLLNPDGYRKRRRRNSSGVDLNRNFPTSNWAHGEPRSRYFGGSRPASEPETRALIRLIGRLHPRRIISIHSISGLRQCNNYDGEGRSMAKTLTRFNGYPVRSTMGYPTPGSFGIWASVENRIPTVTLELPSHHSLRRCWQDNRAGLLRITQTAHHL